MKSLHMKSTRWRTCNLTVLYLGVGITLKTDMILKLL